MEISRDKTGEFDGTTSIRLRYSRQFQNGGHAHTIDAEALLAIGASAEKREQVIRELEAGVEQLARQITQRGSRAVASEAPQPQAPVRANDLPRTAETPAPQPTSPRSAAIAAQPTAPLPVSESMPATPNTSKDRTITLPQFIHAIKKHLNMSPEEARSLLHVSELSGLNYKEAYDTLRALKDSGSASQQSKTTQQIPVVEAPREPGRGTPTAPASRPPRAGQGAPPTAPVIHTPGTTSSRPEATHASTASTVAQESKTATAARDSSPEFASSTRAPLPIQLGTVRDIAPRTYTFEEEEEEEEDYELPVDEEDNMHRQAAESKLSHLKELRNGNAASPERLVALSNVIGDQISDEQLEFLVKEIAGSSNRKKLKIQQVEELISWAKEDYFAEEVNALLEPFDEEE